MKILHISAHYGGGVGTVLNAWKDSDSDNSHRFTHLYDIPANSGELFNPKMVKEHDVVICHVWNHPSMFEFLINRGLPACRLIIWSHISGLYAPDVYSQRLLQYPDRFIFTTPISYSCKEVMELPGYWRQRLGVVWSTYNIDNLQPIERKPHKGFIVGFTGTADYGKLHPQFIDMCAGVKSPVKFVICSHDSQTHLKTKAESLSISDRFSFMGKVPNVAEQLTTFDVFGYPLQHTHFGSCEQAIGEAMACGAVPVVLGNPTERHIVEHMATGVVAEDTDDYSRAIDYLFTHREDLSRISENAGKEARKRYNIQNMVRKWNKVLETVELFPIKTRFPWCHSAEISPALIYAISLGSYGKSFWDYIFADGTDNLSLKRQSAEEIKRLFSTNPAFLSNGKGGIRQYYRYFEGDKYLGAWLNLAEEIGETS